MLYVLFLDCTKAFDYDRKFNSISGCISKTWKLINNILKPCNNNDKNIKLKYNNSEVPINEVADVFNNYFSTIGNKLKNNIPTCTNDFNNFLPNSLNNSIYITPTNYSEVSLMINKLKLNKGNINNPNNKIYKLLNSFISIPITLIFNCIVATGIYPKTLKIACVTPLFKSGNKGEVSNYRPISCLPTLNTIIEKLLHQRIMRFLDKNKILNTSQFGFRSGMSTTDAVTSLLSEIYDSMNSHKYFGTVSLDLSKAFDTVDHTILLKKTS